MQLQYYVFAFISLLVEHSTSSSNDWCRFSNEPLNRDNWLNFKDNIIKCLKYGATLENNNEYFTKMANDISVLPSPMETNDFSQNIVALDNTSPLGASYEITQLLNRQISKVSEIIRNRVTIVDISGIYRIRKVFRFDNVSLAFCLAAFLIISTSLALIELFLSWEKLRKSRRLTQTASPSSRTLKWAQSFYRPSTLKPDTVKDATIV